MFNPRNVEQLKETVTDPEKQEIIDSLTEREWELLTLGTTNPETDRIIQLKPTERTPEEQALLDRYNSIITIRVIALRNLIDWASNRALEIEKFIFEFIDDETFVSYPEVFENTGTSKDTSQAQAVRAAIQTEWMDRSSQKLHQLEEYNLEILGMRIGKENHVEVLITHNQTTPAGYGQPAFNFSQETYNIPPTASIGLVKQRFHTAGETESQPCILIIAPYSDRRGKKITIEVELPFTMLE